MNSSEIPSPNRIGFAIAAFGVVSGILTAIVEMLKDRSPFEGISVLLFGIATAVFNDSLFKRRVIIWRKATGNGVSSDTLRRARHSRWLAAGVAILATFFLVLPSINFEELPNAGGWSLTSVAIILLKPGWKLFRFLAKF